MSDKVWVRPTRAGHGAARRWQSWLVALAAIGCGALLYEAGGAWPFAGAQNRGKVFEKTHDPRPRPVDLVELKAKDKVVKFGEAFESGQDWLNGATFRVKNKSGEEVVYAARLRPQQGQGGGQLRRLQRRDGVGRRGFISAKTPKTLTATAS